MAGQRVDRALGLETVAHVESEDQRLDAEFLFQAVVEGLQPVRPTTGDDQIVTQFGQRPCGGGSYARGSSRDKCRFAHVPVRFVLRPGGFGAPSRRCGGNLDGSSAKIGNFALLCILHAEYFKTDGPMGRLNLEYFLAKRIASVSSGRRNNVMVRVATLSVAIGVAVMIVSLAVIFGFKREITAKLSGFGAHVQIASLDGNASSYETEPVSRDQPFADYLRGIPRFESFNPYAVKGGILRGEEAMQGIVLKGVDSTYDWTPMRRSLVAGRLPDVSDTVRHKEVLLSRAVADRMEADVGDPIEMLFVQNPPRRDRFRVSGIYDTGFGELDRVLALTDLRNVQRLNGWDSTQVSGFELRTTDFSHLDRFTDDVYRAVVEHQRTDRDEPLRVTNVRMQYPMIFDWLDAHNVNAAVIITVMLLVALFNMIAALLIILLERTRMIGVLKTLGMGNGALQKMFVIRSSFIILRGMVWGNLIGIGLCLLQYFTGWITLDEQGYFLTTLPVSIRWGWVLMLNAGTFVLIVALLSLPTMLISFILPERSIRFE